MTRRTAHSEEEMKRRRQPLLRLLAERIVEAYLIEIGELHLKVATKPTKAVNSSRPTVEWTPALLGAFEQLKLSADDVLARARLLAAIPRTPHAEGVYFLIAENRIMYVGSSSDLRERLSQHRGRPCTHFAWVEAPRFYRDLEAHYINQFAPPWNSNHPTTSLAAPPPRAENAPDARSTVRPLLDRPAAADVD